MTTPGQPAGHTPEGHHPTGHLPNTSEVGEVGLIVAFFSIAWECAKFHF